MKFDSFLDVFRTPKRKGSLVLAYRLKIRQQTVEQWRITGIPSKYWKPIISASRGKITSDNLLQLTSATLKQRGIE